MNSALLALVTILLWSSLALLTDRISHLPPLLSVGLVLTACGLAGAVRLRRWRVSAATWLTGVGGIFGYHFLLFAAFGRAPAVEANMIQYLWPLCIVLFSPLFLPRNRLAANHLLGAGLGLAGAGLIVTGGSFGLRMEYLPGYLCALGAAVTWACYSLQTKRLQPFPSAAVGGFCLVSGLLSLALHFLLGAPGPNPTGADWLVILLLGLGPMGAAFYTWDAAMKRGDPRMVGALSYLTPLLSTLLLVAVNGKRFTPLHGLAVLLVTSGAVFGSLDTLRPLFASLARRRRT
ncbi:DMT family transporter [Pseudodesulfovibrio indicus]|uniref:Permease n=1 Tax=Pseudodesulfovibrio indicus TaxID=1716143 RepID=A0A126QLS8_9BACT|nr:DMT family transporter [Pseudodesulfovibrio indicus]AMK10922.1 permease [Pseudodesulfovibrio indicus]TDT91914.1 drug/metabolite transporter (DMT)-like permease [Pseudodesulfovibrio indicus]